MQTALLQPPRMPPLLHPVDHRCAHIAAANSRPRCLVIRTAATKGRRTARQKAEPEPEPIEEEPPVAFIASSRGRRSRRADPDAAAAAAAPVKAKRKKAVPVGKALEADTNRKIIKTNIDGDLFIDRGGLGDGHVNWYAVAVLDGKEDKFKAILTQRLKELAPLEEPVTGEMVERDIEIWVPTKVMQVYSKATDKLVPKSMPYMHGGWVFVRCILDNEAIDMVQGTYYCMGWRFKQPWSSRLLPQDKQRELGTVEDEDYELPVPLTEEFLASVHTWLETPESEDLEQRRIETYGVAGGTIFGVSERKDQIKELLDQDAAGRNMYKTGTYDAAGTYMNPSGWTSGNRRARSSYDNADAGRGAGASRRPQRARDGGGRRGVQRDSDEGDWDASSWDAAGWGASASQQQQQQWPTQPPPPQQQRQWGQQQQWDEQQATDEFGVRFGADVAGGSSTAAWQDEQPYWAEEQPPPQPAAQSAARRDGRRIDGRRSEGSGRAGGRGRGERTARPGFSASPAVWDADLGSQRYRSLDGHDTGYDAGEPSYAASSSRGAQRKGGFASSQADAYADDGGYDAGFGPLADAAFERDAVFGDDDVFIDDGGFGSYDAPGSSGRNGRDGGWGAQQERQRRGSAGQQQGRQQGQQWREQQGRQQQSGSGGAGGDAWYLADDLLAWKPKGSKNQQQQQDAAWLDEPGYQQAWGQQDDQWQDIGQQGQFQQDDGWQEEAGQLWDQESGGWQPQQQQQRASCSYTDDFGAGGDSDLGWDFDLGAAAPQKGGFGLTGEFQDDQALDDRVPPPPGAGRRRQRQ